MLGWTLIETLLINPPNMHNWLVEAPLVQFLGRLTPWKDNCLNKLHFCICWAFCSSARTFLVVHSTENTQVLDLHSSLSSSSSYPFTEEFPFFWLPWKSAFILDGLWALLPPFPWNVPAQDKVSVPAGPNKTPHRTLTQAPGWTSAAGLANCCCLCTERVPLAFILEHHKIFTLSPG